MYREELEEKDGKSTRDYDLMDGLRAHLTGKRERIIRNPLCRLSPRNPDRSDKNLSTFRGGNEPEKCFHGTS